MLVDLGRNDLGRVCEYGTVKVSDFFTIEKYSHVMHIVSQWKGLPTSPLSIWCAAFPTGMSAVRQCDAAESRSDVRAARGLFGYFGFDGKWIPVCHHHGGAEIRYRQQAQALSPIRIIH
jgi:anthranilate/para-aminobenzoate synthase component I